MMVCTWPGIGVMRVSDSTVRVCLVDPNLKNYTKII